MAVKAFEVLSVTMTSSPEMVRIKKILLIYRFSDPLNSEKNINISKRFFNYFVVIDKSSKVKIHKRKEKGIWNNLYEFELLETNNKISFKEAESYLKEKYQNTYQKY